MTTITETDELRLLRSEVAELRDQLATIDREAFTVELVMEDHEQWLSSLHYALTTTMEGLWGKRALRDEANDSLPAVHYRRLWPEMTEHGFRQMQSRRHPRCSPRRWRQFGSLADVVAIAKAHKVQVKAGEAREWILRDVLKAGAELVPRRFDGR